MHSDTSRKGKPSSNDPFLDDIRQMKEAWMRVFGHNLPRDIFNDNFKLVIDTLNVHVGHCSLL